MKLLIVTDAWDPQTNGVVTTLRNVIVELELDGIEVTVVHPGLFKTLPLPSYPEIRVAINPWRVGSMILQARPDTIHIATEGPLGIAARLLLTRRSIPFSTSLHTKFPEYVAQRVGLPLSIGYRLLRWFHRPAYATLVTTASHQRELERWGMQRLIVWGRGVDANAFKPRPRRARTRPRLLYAGRIAVEKNLEAFLTMPFDADKVIVGDGPAREALQQRFPDAEWVGYKYGSKLADYYSDADAFVFPSKTDTFGLVMLEAMACGTPVAAFPVTGPADVVIDGVNGALDADLQRATMRALLVDRAACRAYAEGNAWRSIARKMAALLVIIDWNLDHAKEPISQQSY
jgi:glycosyltransferase involved in cell wall biosynthesis